MSVNNDQEFLVQKIRSQYTEKQYTELDELKAMDAKVKVPANVFAIVFGSLSAIIMGTGMSLVMTNLGQILGLTTELSMVVGVSAGLVGLVLTVLAYPVYGRVLKKERQRIAPEILRLSDELLK